MSSGTKTRQKAASGNPQTLSRLISDSTASAKGPDAQLLRRLRQICLSLPEAAETVKWGHPTFEAGKKIFAVLDNYHGQPCIAFRAPEDEQKKLLRDKRFFPAPYASAHGWVCLRAEGKLNWTEVRDLTVASYRLVALKRMLVALSGSRGESLTTIYPRINT
jgi:predicted DNA-binding protein (MmcQ/YjbR family)